MSSFKIWGLIHELSFQKLYLNVLLIKQKDKFQ